MLQVSLQSGSVCLLNQGFACSISFGAGQVAACQGRNAGEILRLPLSFFGSGPRLGHVASWCAVRAWFTKVVYCARALVNSMNLSRQVFRAVRHLDWKMLLGRNVPHLSMWKSVVDSGPRDLSWEMPNPWRNMVRMPPARW